MTMNFQPASAKIYEFPARGRFAAGGRIDDATSAKFLTPRGGAVVLGSNWYHEEAIQEEQKHND